MTPLRSTAKEQLAEWKSRFDARLKAEPKADKKAVTLEITDDAFEVMPTEEAVAEWMETRAAGDRLQVNGNVSCNSVFAKSPTANIYADSTSGAATIGLRKDGTSILYMQMPESCNGFYWGANQPGGGGFRNIGGYSYTADRWNFTSTDAVFSGTVKAPIVSGDQGQGFALVRDNAITPQKNGASVNNTLNLGEASFQWKQLFAVTTRSQRVIQDGAPVIDAKGLINTLSTLRNATKDETTLEGMRDALADAIGGLIENFEHEIATMPAEVSE
jgi:hypothetical protein